MKKRIEKINIFFLLLLPFVDIITALTTRLIEIPISLGIIIKGLYTIIITLYIILYVNTKEKKYFLCYLGIILIYCLLFILTKSHLLWNINLLTDFIALYKYLFTGFILFAYIVIYKNEQSNKFLTKIMFYTLICYTILLIVPQITNTAFNSYENKPNEGKVGWFYAANEISAIILILFPFYFSKLEEKLLQKKYLYLLLIVPIVYSIYIIGTKTSWYGLILLSIIIFIIFLIKERKNKKKLVFSFLLVILLILLNFNSPTNNNLNKSINGKNTIEKISEKDFSKCGQYHKIKEVIKNDQVVKVMHVVLSGRENKAYTQWLIYINSPLDDKIFGLGFIDNSIIDNCYVERYIEIDLLDGLIHYGIVGFLIMVFPYFYVLKLLKYKNLKQINSVSLIYLFTFLLLFALSFASGHILGYPTPSIYLNLLLIIIINEVNYMDIDKSKKIKKC